MYCLEDFWNLESKEILYLCVGTPQEAASPGISIPWPCGAPSGTAPRQGERTAPKDGIRGGYREWDLVRHIHPSLARRAVRDIVRNRAPWISLQVIGLQLIDCIAIVALW